MGIKKEPPAGAGGIFVYGQTFTPTALQAAVILSASLLACWYAGWGKAAVSLTHALRGASRGVLTAAFSRELSKVPEPCSTQLLSAWQARSSAVALAGVAVAELHPATARRPAIARVRMFSPTRERYPRQGWCLGTFTSKHSQALALPATRLADLDDMAADLTDTTPDDDEDTGPTGK